MQTIIQIFAGVIGDRSSKFGFTCARSAVHYVQFVHVEKFCQQVSLNVHLSQVKNSVPQVTKQCYWECSFITR